ncbi:hypothetical protein EUX98_g9794 [Antrodiella citrinella]|uniref:Uncharacterized protein n=1 Tax=Antrodiella citrinella TaxID=2447956 RepID=A0A4S4LME5_9APHY|nr:hypothetical protein EUX98_g9794 [Antrodiella citrinella]
MNTFLDQLYANVDQYATILSSVITYASKGKDKARQLRKMAEPDVVRVSTELHQQGGRVDIIYPRNLDVPEAEEMVLRTQGYVVYAQLPPISKQSQLNRKDLHAHFSINFVYLDREL